MAVEELKGTNGDRGGRASRAEVGRARGGVRDESSQE